MKLPFTIEDFYGYEVTVEPLMGSVGHIVDVDFEIDGPNSGVTEHFRFEPEDALKLAEAIKAAAEARF